VRIGAGGGIRTRDGGYLPRPKSSNGWFTRAVKGAGVQRITPHDLRHTCASLAVSAGVNVLALARMLGHKDPSLTMRVYADLFDTDLDTVAASLHAGMRRNFPPRRSSRGGETRWQAQRFASPEQTGQPLGPGRRPWLVHADLDTKIDLLDRLLHEVESNFAVSTLVVFGLL
jgi:hypothetical protein